MLRLSLRALFAHKARLLLTTLSVVLGVAFVTGMLMLTSALDRTFVDIFEGSAQDVLVTPQSAVEIDVTQDTGAGEPLTLGDDVVEAVQGVEGVAVAAGGISRNGAYLLDSEGEVVGAVGPPALGVNAATDPELSLATVTEGASPTGPTDVAVDDVTFPKLGINIGEKVTVLTPDGPFEADLVGTFRFGETGGLAGATLAAFTAETAQRLFAEPGQWNFVEVAVAEGFTDADVAAAVATELGDGYDVLTREEQVEQSADQLRDGLGFISYILVGFGAIALFVSAFLIYNTFSMLVAQRGKELALLRAVGATQTQVLRGVLSEAIVLALVAAALGVAVGYLLALGLKAGVGALGLDLTSGVSLTAQAITWALVVGIVVTVLSAVGPAVRAARIPPMAALREASAPAEKVSRLRTVSGLIITVGSAAILARAMVVEQPPGPTALAALALLIGGVLLAPTIGSSAARLAAPLMGSLGKVPGRIAARNAARSPRRIAATAAALMIGLSLVSGVTVIVSSAKAAIDSLIDTSLGADLIVATQSGQPFSTQIAEGIRDVDGVQYVISEAVGPALIEDTESGILALGGGPFTAAYDPVVLEGAVGELVSGETYLPEDFAEAIDATVGDRVEMLFPSGQTLQLDVEAIFEVSVLTFSPVIPLDDYRGVGGAAQDTSLQVVLDEGADSDAVVAQIEEETAANPLLDVLDQSEIKELSASVLDQLLYIIYAMLGLSIVIAALGVVNTMALSVLERTREIGLLRAVGLSRRQVRRMVRWEGVLVSLLGGALGIAIGIFAGAAIQQSLVEFGISTLVIPTGTIIVLLVAALIIGLLGAAFPARRAANLNMLEAISTE